MFEIRGTNSDSRYEVLDSLTRQPPLDFTAVNVGWINLHGWMKDLRTCMEIYQHLAR